MSISILYAFYSGFRTPSLWSINYYQVSFADGFYRRALTGTFLLPLGCERFDYFVIQKIQFLVLFLTLGLFVYIGVKNREFLALSVYFASAAGGYFFHEVGYIEQLLWLLTAAILFALNNNRIYIASVGLCLSVLVHEMAIFMVLPLVLAFILIHKKELFLTRIKVFVPAVVVFLVMHQWFQVVPPDTIMHYFETASRCDYPVIRQDYFNIYEYQFLGERSRQYYSAMQFVLGILPVCISAFLLTFPVRKELNFTALQKYSILFCCLSPLFLGFFGWDSDRWIFLAFTQTLIIGMIISSKLRETQSENLLGRRYIFVPLILMALLLHLDYFDYFTSRILTLEKLSSFKDYMFYQITTLPQL